MVDDFASEAASDWLARHSWVDADAVTIALRLRRVGQQLDRALEAELGASRVQVLGDHQVLSYLYRRGPARPSTLAADLNVTPTGINGRTKRLAAAGLVAMKPDEVDRRSHLVCLTREGSRVAVRGFERAHATYASILDGLDRDSQRIFAEHLAQVLHNLNRFDDSD